MRLSSRRRELSFTAFLEDVLKNGYVAQLVRAQHS